MFEICDDMTCTMTMVLEPWFAIRWNRAGWVLRTSHVKNLRLVSGVATYVMNAN